MTISETLSSKARPRAGARSGATGLNNLLSWVLLAIAAISPIPLGSNNSVAWSVSATVIALLATTYGVALLVVRDTLRVRLLQILPEAILWLAMLLFIGFQLLPAQLWGGSPVLTSVDGNLYPLSRVSAAPGMSILSAINFAGYGIFFWLCLQVTANRQRAQQLAQALFAIVVVHAIWGLLALTFWGDALLLFDKWAYHGVATGTFVNRNSYATFLAVGFVLGTGLTLRATLRRRSERGQRLPRRDEVAVRIGLYLVGTILVMAALLASQSRMGLAAATIGAMLVFAIAAAKQRDGTLRYLAIAAMIAIPILAIAVMIYGAGVLERLGSVESAGDVRMQLYVQVMDMISSHWLTGTGAGSFETVFPLFHRWPVSPDVVWDKAHNTYLALWSEMGILAGSIPIVVFALLATRLIVIIIRRSEDWWLSAMSLATVSVIAMHSLVDFSMEIQGVVYLTILIVSLGLDLRGRSAGNRQDS